MPPNPSAQYHNAYPRIVTPKAKYATLNQALKAMPVQSNCDVIQGRKGQRMTVAKTALQTVVAAEENPFCCNRPPITLLNAPNATDSKTSKSPATLPPVVWRPGRPKLRSTSPAMAIPQPSPQLTGGQRRSQASAIAPVATGSNARIMT